MSYKRKCIVFIYVFFLFFGPKIGEYIDSSIVASILTILFIAKKNHSKISLDTYVVRRITGILLIILYTIIVSIYNRYFDITFYGRMIRSLCSIFSIYLFIHNTSISRKEINDIVIYVLLIHAIIVLVSATVFIDLQYFLRPFNGYRKKIRQYRSTGLMMGFDMSGVLCNLGLVLVLSKKNLNIVHFLIFSISTLFTSRFSVIFLIVVTLAYMFVNRKNADTRMKKIILFVTIIPTAVFSFLLLSITISDLGFFQSSLSTTFPTIYRFAATVNYAYKSTETLNMMGTKHFMLNSDWFLTLVGTGIYGGADPGYTRIINCIGIIGLIIVILWHYYSFRGVIVHSRITNQSDKYSRIFIFGSLILVLVLLDFKNCYFFTGTFFEFMMIQLFSWKELQA